MDKKKKMSWRNWALILALAPTFFVQAQDVSEVQFCGYGYERGVGKDSVKLYFNILDSNKKHNTDINAKEMANFLSVEDNHKAVPVKDMKVRELRGGMRIPAEYTFSVLVDRGLPTEGKQLVFEAVERLVATAPDSCVFLSFYGDNVTSTSLVTRSNIHNFKEKFMQEAGGNCFYSAVYAKLTEFANKSAEKQDQLKVQEGYEPNNDIGARASKNGDKNMLLLFTDGLRNPDLENIDHWNVIDYQRDTCNLVPQVFGFYYVPVGVSPEENVELTLTSICKPRFDSGKDIDKYIEGRQGKFMPADNMDKLFEEFENVMADVSYDYELAYKVPEDARYFGNTHYEAFWRGSSVGQVDYAIGSPETPWPQRETTTAGTVMKYLWALLIAFLTYISFFIVVKILIPLFKSKRFEMKYYKPYTPERNVKTRTCSYCRQDIRPGQKVVTKCRHIMHVGCWQQAGYHCTEFGQNCNTGIQEHVDFNNLLSKRSFKDCHLVLSGILAALVSWVCYELLGRGSLFTGMAKGIANTVFAEELRQMAIYHTCVDKVAAFLAIGFLLGFFLSIVFRYNDEYREKNWKVWLKIIGLSLLSAIIGMAAFAMGGLILCLWLSSIDSTTIPWYCSLPAYILFSICMAMSLTIKSSIPKKSALLGGSVSAVIGFFVLYFSSLASSSKEWMSMLLNFIIYGGGLGASLVTVRMLAEKYFLVIKNGVKEGLRIPIHKWMGVGNKVTIGMAGDCEIQMNWEKSNKVAKEHAVLFIDPERFLPMLKPQAVGILYNMRVELPTTKAVVLSNGDTFQIGDTTFQYEEAD